jgi:hypothetical protein
MLFQSHKRSVITALVPQLEIVFGWFPDDAILDFVNTAVCSLVYKSAVICGQAVLYKADERSAGTLAFV